MFKMFWKIGLVMVLCLALLCGCAVTPAGSSSEASSAQTSSAAPNTSAALGAVSSTASVSAVPASSAPTASTPSEVVYDLDLQFDPTLLNSTINNNAYIYINTDNILTVSPLYASNNPGFAAVNGRRNAANIFQLFPAELVVWEDGTWEFILSDPDRYSDPNAQFDQDTQWGSEMAELLEIHHLLKNAWSGKQIRYAGCTSVEWWCTSYMLTTEGDYYYGSNLAAVGVKYAAGQAVLLLDGRAGYLHEENWSKNSLVDMQTRLEIIEDPEWHDIVQVSVPYGCSPYLFALRADGKVLIKDLADKDDSARPTTRTGIEVPTVQLIPNSGYALSADNKLYPLLNVNERIGGETPTFTVPENTVRLFKYSIDSSFLCLLDDGTVVSPTFAETGEPLLTNRPEDFWPTLKNVKTTP